MHVYSRGVKASQQLLIQIAEFSFAKGLAKVKLRGGC
jgi:hypothetical protein